MVAGLIQRQPARDDRIRSCSARAGRQLSLADCVCRRACMAQEACRATLELILSEQLPIARACDWVAGLLGSRASGLPEPTDFVPFFLEVVRSDAGRLQEQHRAAQQPTTPQAEGPEGHAPAQRPAADEQELDVASAAAFPALAAPSSVPEVALVAPCCWQRAWLAAEPAACSASPRGSSSSPAGRWRQALSQCSPGMRPSQQPVRQVRGSAQLPDCCSRCCSRELAGCRHAARRCHRLARQSLGTCSSSGQTCRSCQRHASPGEQPAGLGSAPRGRTRRQLGAASDRLQARAACPGCPCRVGRWRSNAGP